MVNLGKSSLIATSIVALAACSGGGGDESPLNYAAITTANAPAIAGAVMSSSLEGSNLGSFADLGAAAGPPKSSQSKLVSAKVVEIEHAYLDTLLKGREPAIALAPIPTETTACTGGGAVTVSGSLANPLTLSPNDTIILVFDSCVEDGATVSGRFAMRVTSFSGSPESGEFALGINVELTSFLVAGDGETATANGSIAVTINISAATLTTTVAANSISISDGSSSQTLSNYSATRTVAAGLGSFTLDMAGTLTSTDFSGSVTFDTTTLLQGTGSGFAFTGLVVITGANGATIKVIAIDSNLVRLEIDQNGDGTIDASIDTSWAELV
jgi:hypothetical protein